MTNVQEAAQRNADVARARTLAHLATLTEAQLAAGTALTAEFNACLAAALVGRNTPWFA